MGRSFYSGFIAGLDAPSCQNNPKHSALEFWRACAGHHLAPQAPLKAVDRGTWRAQPRQFDDCSFAEMEPGSERQMLEWESGRCDILTQLSGPDQMPSFAEFIEELRADQVDLSVVRPSRPHSGDKSVSNMFAGMRIAFYPVIFDKGDVVPGRFTERVLRVTGNCEDDPAFLMHVRLPNDPADWQLHSELGSLRDRIWAYFSG